MNCSEARRLMNQGCTPRSYPHLNAQLGFHLSKCLECRTYWERRESLLSSLLLGEQHEGEPSPYQSDQPYHSSPVHAVPAYAPARVSDSARTVEDEDEDEDEDNDSPSRWSGIVHWFGSIDIVRMVWLFSIVVLVLVPVGGGVWLASILIRAHNDVDAMIVPTPVPTAASPMTDPGAGGGPPGSTTTEPAPTKPAPTEPGAADLAPLEASPTDTENTSDSASIVHTPTLPLPTIAAADQQQAEATVPTPWPTIQSLLPDVGPAPQGAAGASSPGTNRGAPESGDAATILFLGNDRRPGEAGIPRTDAIMLVRADPQNNRIALLSLPRDLWVEIPGYGAARINAAYVWGELYNAPGGGLNLARETVSTLLGIPVDYVTMVDFEGFIGLIDTLGGVTVHVEKELYDPSFPTMDYGYRVAHFEPGPQHMDGLTALTYSRTRHPDSDFMRTTRQQAVLMAIGQRLQERGDLQNVATVDQITASLRGFVQTTIPEERMVELVWGLRQVDMAAIEQYSIQSDMVTWGAAGDPYALMVHPDILASLVQQFLGQG